MPAELMAHSNRLRFSPAKTDVICLVSPHRLQQCTTDPLLVGVPSRLFHAISRRFSCSLCIASRDSDLHRMQEEVSEEERWKKRTDGRQIVLRQHAAIADNSLRLRYASRPAIVHRLRLSHNGSTRRRGFSVCRRRLDCIKHGISPFVRSVKPAVAPYDHIKPD